MDPTVGPCVTDDPSVYPLWLFLDLGLTDRIGSCGPRPVGQGTAQSYSLFAGVTTADRVTSTTAAGPDCEMGEEISVMSKPTVSALFLGSVVAVIAGAILAFVAVWIAYANGAFIMDGHDVVGVQSTPAAWIILGLAIVAAVAVIAGLIGGLVSWIGALLNTAQLDDKLWFVLLLVLGLWNFGLVAMIAYVIAGPDSTSVSTQRPGQAAA